MSSEKHIKFTLFVDLPHRNDASENPHDKNMADMMHYVNDMEERLKGSIVVEIQRMKERDDHNYP